MLKPFGLANINSPSRVVGGRGGGGGFDGGGGDVPPPPPTLQVFPWWFYPPPASTYFYVDTLNALGASQVAPPGASDLAVQGAGFIVNDGDRAVIVGISLVTQSPTAADNYFFTLKRNGGPVQGADRLRNFAVVANASVRDFSGYAIKLEPGDEVSWSITNLGLNPITFNLNYQGWRSSLNEIERIQQGVNY